jgi:hypothetical protein
MNHHVEVCLFSQWDDVSIPIFSIEEKHSLFPQSHTLTSLGFPYGWLSRMRER